MPNMMIDVESIVEHNPQVSRGSLLRAEALMVRMCKLGIEKTNYRLASPFSSSLRKIRKASRSGKSRKSA